MPAANAALSGAPDKEKPRAFRNARGCKTKLFNQVLPPATALVNLNVARSEQVQVIGTVADLEYQIAAGTHDSDIEPIGAGATLFSISKSADERNRRPSRFVLTTHVTDAMPVNDVNRDPW